MGDQAGLVVVLVADKERVRKEHGVGGRLDEGGFADLHPCDERSHRSVEQILFAVGHAECAEQRHQRVRHASSSHRLQHGPVVCNGQYLIELAERLSHDFVPVDVPKATREGGSVLCRAFVVVGFGAWRDLLLRRLLHVPSMLPLFHLLLALVHLLVGRSIAPVFASFPAVQGAAHFAPIFANRFVAVLFPMRS